jgi:hypothetical protein
MKKYFAEMSGVAAPAGCREAVFAGVGAPAVPVRKAAETQKV